MDANLNEILALAAEAYENRPATLQAGGHIVRSNYFTYRVPDSNLSIYIIPVDRRISARAAHLRYQFEINNKRVNREAFVAALGGAK